MVIASGLYDHFITQQVDKQSGIILYIPYEIDRAKGSCLFQKALIRAVTLDCSIARTEHKKTDALSACSLEARDILESRFIAFFRMNQIVPPRTANSSIALVTIKNIKIERQVKECRAFHIIIHISRAR